MANRSRVAFRFLAAAALFLIALVAHAAKPQPFRDAADGFSLDFAPAGARTCVVRVVGQEDDASCQGLDLEAVRTTLPPGGEAVIVSRRSARYRLTHSVQPIATGSAWVRAVSDWAKARYPTAEVRPKYSELVSRTHVGMAEVMRIDLVVSEPSRTREPLEFVTWLIPGRSAFHVFDVEAPASSAALARADFQAALPTLTVTISPYAMLWVAFIRYWHVPLFVLVPASTLVIYLLLRRAKRTGGKLPKVISR